MKDVTNKFSVRLKQLRQEHKLSLEQLAKAIGVSTMAISRWENETRIPNIEALILLANYFCVSSDYILGIEEE